MSVDAHQPVPHGSAPSASSDGAPVGSDAPLRVADTPGPWVAVEVGHGGSYDNPFPVYEVLSERERICENVSERHARLIAAAPDLAAALECAGNVLALLSSEVAGLGCGANKVRGMVAAALAKARGDRS